MTPLQKIFAPLFLLFAAASAQVCDPAQGTGQCGYLGADGIYNSQAEAADSYQRLYYNNTYVEPAPMYIPPQPPPQPIRESRYGRLPFIPISVAYGTVTKCLLPFMVFIQRKAPERERYRNANARAATPAKSLTTPTNASA